MYFPYFRGKQFELIAIRESAARMAEVGIVPIIEPVKEALRGLGRALDAVKDAGGHAVVVINPHCGDHSEDGGEILPFLAKYQDYEDISVGILLTAGMSLQEAQSYLDGPVGLGYPTLIHAGFIHAKSLAEGITDLSAVRNVFLEPNCGKLYRKYFSGSQRVLIRDGFKKRRNADHPPVEDFSELHITYEDEGMDGFGDFLIVGDEFSEGGGPAYAVAIHLTFLDPSKDEVMEIYHFVSRTRDTPADPGGKFAEALDLLVERLDSGQSHLIETAAINEFRVLHKKRHFPGLGTAKKLSMLHHIETLADYIEKQDA